jgi:hypothetical protein
MTQKPLTQVAVGLRRERRTLAEVHSQVPEELPGYSRRGQDLERSRRGVDREHSPLHWEVVGECTEPLSRVELELDRLGMELVQYHCLTLDTLGLQIK